MKSKAQICGLARSIVFCALFACSTPLYAQPKPSDSTNAPTGRIVDAEPQNTTATFGDWIMRCNRIVEAGGQVQHQCEVVHYIIVQGQQAPFALVAVGRVKKADPLRITIILPVNVTFPSAPRVFSDAKDSEGLELTWKLCLPTGCVADATPKDEIVRAWRGSRTQGRIETKDHLGRNVVATISFKGISQALDALGKEP